MFLLISNFNNIGNWLWVSSCCKETTVKVAQNSNISVRSLSSNARGIKQSPAGGVAKKIKFENGVYHTRKCAYASYMLCSITRKSTQHSCVVSLKVAQNSFQHFPRRRVWWVIITTLYQLMLQSWYQKTVQSLVNTLVLFSWHYRLP